ncbi:UDP-glucuronosyltransferase 2B10-like isoform X2 [Trichoplusia ni]|uniref:UDP-glucuronosyltransferase 2B10-like isoform X1 n=1 Tax=Trichoplusia ni TaxID=7111 RepID=A0A7E5W5S3_TRINI|nr:UDP-glucuronosyltransferase 2B10-like isoform X1 [Trichoplusia ni]XP_026735996.1 UDP-glucuronosyltransferase 2B10-like isoform X2 [Trichoplusia ni]
MKLLILFGLTLLCGVESLKILVYFPLPVRSVGMLGQGIVRHLLDAGHEVTFVTVYPMKDVRPSLKQVDISSNKELVAKDESLMLSFMLENNVQDTDVLYIQTFFKENSRQTFTNENFTKFLQDTSQRFDLVLADLMESEVSAGLSVVYDCPYVWYYSMGAHWHVLRLIDEGKNPAYDPDYLTTTIAPFSFLQRVEQLWARIKYKALKTFITLPEEKKIYEEIFTPLLAQRGRTLPNYENVIYNASLVFGNEHNAVKHRPSTPQNFKYVGGIHIPDPVTPLPKKLQDLMDNAKHGVIYFSMGSFFKSKHLPQSLVRGLVKTFGELKETVLWKFEEDLTDLPSNLHILQWAPQASILAHPNLKFFITHGGLLSSIEAIHFGVPVITIPVYFDQFTNAEKAVKNGYAIRVPLSYDLPETLRPAIKSMLSDDIYKKKVTELSIIYHDRLVPPGKELVHWVEHVVKTRGALHLRSPALNVPLYQRLFLDLLAVILVILYIIRRIIKNLTTKTPKKTEKKKKN